jgi:DNA topoisomerase-6 subunit A
MSKKKEVKKLEDMGKAVLERIRKNENPEIKIPVRSLSNVYFDEAKELLMLGDAKSSRYYLNVAHSKKFMQTMLVASFCKKLLNEGISTSIRDLYYSLKHTIAGTNENTFNEQSDSDPIIEDVEVTIDLLREQINLKAKRKGYMVGKMLINDSGDEIDLTRLGSGGYGIPSNVEADVIDFKKIDADYVLVVEKAAVWERLNEDKFWKKHNCVLVTGEGQPSRGVRRIINRLHFEKKLPIYVLMDNDPWGIYIYSVIKQGSINLAHLSAKLGVPEAKFVGINSTDFEKFGLSKNVEIKMTDADIKRCKELLKYEWFKSKEWQKEIKNMIKTKRKMEIEALSNKGVTFISKEYLPTKIENKDFLN